jgi:PAP2 superfamily
MLKSNLINYICFILVISLFSTGCSLFEKKNPNFQQEAANPEFLHRSMLSLTSTIKHDLFPPMIAARIYNYAHIAGYEALVAGTPQYMSLAGQLKDLTELPKPEAGKEYCYPIASAKAYLKVGKKLIFSEDSIENFTLKLLKEFKDIGIPSDVFDRSVALGDTMGGAIIKWLAKDNYAQTRSMPKYTVRVTDPTRWRPTAPDYDDASEPHWNKIRTMVMDSAAQFKPVPPTRFDSAKNSLFYKEAYEVYKSVIDSTAERIAIARYWDDSPSSTQNAGHVNFKIKKVTPPGHWLHIGMYVSRQQKKDIFQVAEMYARLSIAMFDGVISCWDEKYRSEVIRPESYINKYIFDNWTPIIVTPPFPEYTSGHSVFSGVASQTLTTLFGDNISFIDSTEMQFGMPPRTFKSFNEAADQAAISRLYGGIHFRPAIEVGIKQGRAVGEYVFKKITTLKNRN